MSDKVSEQSDDNDNDNAMVEWENELAVSGA